MVKKSDESLHYKHNIVHHDITKLVALIDQLNRLNINAYVTILNGAETDCSCVTSNMGQQLIVINCNKSVSPATSTDKLRQVTPEKA